MPLAFFCWPRPGSNPDQGAELRKRERVFQRSAQGFEPLMTHHREKARGAAIPLAFFVVNGKGCTRKRIGNPVTVNRTGHYVTLIAY